jgi:putative MATE family efflux protein
MKLFDKKIVTSLFAIAAPIIIENLVQYIQIQVDIAMLGRYDVKLLSAVGNVLFPYNIMFSFLMAISIGATVLIAHAIGAKSTRSAKRYSEVSFFYNILMSIPIFLIFFFFSHTIMKWMGTSVELVNASSVFLKYLSISFLCFGIEFSVIAILQGMGRTKAIMYAAILRTLINIALDWILIYGKLGFPEMGIKGAAIATTISNISATLFFIIYLITDKKLDFKPSLRGIFTPKWSIEKNSIIVGLPYGIEAMLWSIGQLILIRLINFVDPYAAGSFILIVRIQALTLFFYLGLARGTLTLVGQQIGAGNYNEAFRIGNVSLRIALLICLAGSILFISIPTKILGIFTTDVDTIQYLYPFIYIIAFTIFPVSVNVVIGNAIRGMKDTRWMLMTQIFGTIFVIAMTSVMLFVFHLGIAGIFITILADEFIRAILNYRRFYKVKNLASKAVIA